MNLVDSWPLEVRPPRSSAEWEALFDLRWRVLRAPWGQPLGSERDDLEAASVHRLAFIRDTVLVGVGRMHRLSAEEGQVRYMAVEEGWRGRGIGAAILGELEQEALRLGLRRLRLNAREGAVAFYTARGYRVVEPGPLLFGVIPHSIMAKELA